MAFVTSSKCLDATSESLATSTAPQRTTMGRAPTQPFYDCDGNCLNDADSDGVCDELEIEDVRIPTRATTTTAQPN